MALIFGTEYCKLDSNGRFKFPIALKRQLRESECRFVIRSGILPECLELWTVDSFDIEMNFLHKELSPFSIEDRKLLHRLSACNLVELDTNDRILIPSEQRDCIGNSKEIVLQSTGRFIEIWGLEAYRRFNEEENDLSERIDKRLGNRSINYAETTEC